MVLPSLKIDGITITEETNSHNRILKAITVQQKYRNSYDSVRTNLFCKLILAVGGIANNENTVSPPPRQTLRKRLCILDQPTRNIETAFCSIITNIFYKFVFAVDGIAITKETNKINSKKNTLGNKCLTKNIETAFYWVLNNLFCKLILAVDVDGIAITEETNSHNKRNSKKNALGNNCSTKNFETAFFWVLANLFCKLILKIDGIANNENTFMVLLSPMRQIHTTRKTLRKMPSAIIVQQTNSKQHSIGFSPINSAIDGIAITEETISHNKINSKENAFGNNCSTKIIETAFYCVFTNLFCKLMLAVEGIANNENTVILPQDQLRDKDFTQ
ncbi:hypothetical protein HHI36_022554 [Cryptolaemus montrouzieri]|uniref:Uncharacterized protein n=1 Tax=Cryptolaemus montrouzieri TaxID=559131 RepID=A0ABD2N0V8_9CUCU